MMKYLQNVGKALMMPVSVLPAAAVLMGIGYWIDPTGWGGDSVAAAFFIKAGAAIIDNIPILFAVGIAYGMSKDKHGGAALAGLVGFLTVTTLLSPGAVTQLFHVKELTPIQALAFGKINNAFIGILSGLIASAVYNRFHKVELPDFLAFFSGRRAVAIVTSVIMLAVSGVLLFVWPPVYNGLVTFGETLADMGPLGAGIYGFFNRLLIPIGMHHPLNAVFWFDFAGINDLGNFWGGTGKVGTTGMYMAGFFPVMMFGLPGACLAMYHTAKSNKKKAVYGLLLAAAVASFFTGVTEPIEFSFMFVAPVLYVIHAVLTGISMFIAASFDWFAGFGFSAGLIDFVLSQKIKYATNSYMLLGLGVVYFFVYYFIFKFVIIKFNLKTPGRDEDEVEFEEDKNVQVKTNNWSALASSILIAVGGKENITDVDNCATRLRLSVKDSSIVDEAAIKRAGAAGVVKPGKESVQIIIGPKVQFVTDELKKLV
jgi:PTS system N-acetylglucosamine-specific IIC component